MSVLSTVVFADISGSTSLYETLGNERATEAVTQVTHWIADTIETHGGRVVKKLATLMTLRRNAVVVLIH